MGFLWWSAADRISSKWSNRKFEGTPKITPFSDKSKSLTSDDVNWLIWTNGSFPLSDEINGGYPYPKVFLGKTCLIKDTGRWISQFWNHAKVRTWAQSVGNTDDVWSSNRWTKPWDWDNPCELRAWTSITSSYFGVHLRCRLTTTAKWDAQQVHQTLKFLTEALIDSLTATWQNCAGFFPLDPLSTAVSPVSSVSDTIYWLRSMRKQVNSVFGNCIFQRNNDGQETTTHPIILRPRRITWPFATWTERMSGSVVDRSDQTSGHAGHGSNLLTPKHPQRIFRCLKCVWRCWALVAKIWWPKPLRLYGVPQWTAWRQFCTGMDRMDQVKIGHCKSGNTSIWN